MASRRQQRVLVSVAIGLASAPLCWLMLWGHGPIETPFGFSYSGGDFGWSHMAAREFLSGLDPYRYPPAINYPTYPFTAVLVAMPFLLVTPNVAGAVLLGVSSGLMAYGLTRQGWSSLLVFTCCPYFTALQWAQWTPLIFAAAFFPALAFTACIKPQVALPVVLTRLNRVMVISAFALLAASLIVYPSWPLQWLKNLGGYQGYWALLSIPGPLLLLALMRWRERDAQLLLLASIFPQRWFYDALILFLIPKTRKELLYTATFSWGAYFWKQQHFPETTLERGLICTLFFYIPMLAVILLRKRDGGSGSENPVVPDEPSEK